MEDTRVLFSRSTARGSRRLELRGQRLLVGHADTGVFRIGAADSPPAATLAAPPPAHARDDDDGLAPAAIEIAAPLAIVDCERTSDPRKRGRPWRSLPSRR